MSIQPLHSGATTDVAATGMQWAALGASEGQEDSLGLVESIFLEGKMTSRITRIENVAVIVFCHFCGPGILILY